LRDASVLDGAVLEDEGASDDFERDVTSGGAFGSGSGGEHCAFAGGFEVAAEVFVEEHAGDGCASAFFVRRLRIDIDFEAPEASRHAWFFFCRGG